MSIGRVVHSDGNAILDTKFLDVLRDASLRSLQGGHSSWVRGVRAEEFGSLDDELQAGLQCECARND